MADFGKRRLSAFDDAVMGHFVDHLSRDFQPKGCDVTVLTYVRRRLYSRTRAECVKTCTRHNDRLGLRHQQRGRQRRQDGVCVTVGAPLHI